MKRLYQVSFISHTMSETRYEPLFIVRARTEDEVWASLPCIGLVEDVREVWEVSAVPQQKLTALSRLAADARRFVKKRGYRSKKAS